MDKLRHDLKRKLVQHITHALRHISSLSARQGSGIPLFKVRAHPKQHHVTCEAGSRAQFRRNQNAS